MTTPRSRPRRRPQHAKPETPITDSERVRRLYARGMPRKAIEKKLGLSRQTVNSALMRSSTRGRPRGDLHARLTVVTDEPTVEWLRSLARELRVSMGEVLRRMRLAMTELEHDSSPRAAADGGG